MSEVLVRLEKVDRIAIITIDRPKALNALNPDVLAQLAGCLKTARDDKEVSGIILTGAGGKAFVAGADISTMANCSPKEGLAFAEMGLATLQVIEDMPKPVIAAINGFALGGGMELALACDLVYATPGSRLGQPEVKLGIIPGFGGTQRLARLVGRNRAKDLVFTGRHIDAATAREYGIVQEVVPEAELIPFCMKVVESIAAVGPLAVAQAKLAINKGVDLALDAGLAVEKLAFMALFGSKDQKEGMAAFLEKRKPDFKGE
jgi:enoyl-CoA hydratase